MYCIEEEAIQKLKTLLAFIVRERNALKSKVLLSSPRNEGLFYFMFICYTRRQGSKSSLSFYADAKNFIEHALNANDNNLDYYHIIIGIAQTEVEAEEICKNYTEKNRYKSWDKYL